MEHEECRVCGVELCWENTSPDSMSNGLCHTCENDRNGGGCE